MSFLKGRKFLVVGGNGFLGNRIAARLINHQATVSVLSRHGPRFDYPENKKINWIIGSAMQPQLIKDKINQADTIIHSLGALIDTSITKLRQKGEPGTYEQMNRDSFLKVLSVLEQPKQVFYVSSATNLPFTPRYLSTKLEAEQVLFNSKHQGYALRPGFIYDWKLKKFSIPLRYFMKSWNAAYPSIHSLARNGTLFQRFIQQFQPNEPSSLQKIAQTVVYVAANGHPDKILENHHIVETSEKYLKLVEETGKKGRI